MSFVKKLNSYWQSQIEQVKLNRMDEESWISRKVTKHEERGNHVARLMAEGVPFRTVQPSGQYLIMDYTLYVTLFIKNGKEFYIEEAEKPHRATFKNGTLISDAPIESSVHDEPRQNGSLEWEDVSSLETRFTYDRQKAVQYANRWWNDYNPAFRTFENDCTNFISQCLRAGGAPMWGSPSRSKGWWYTAKTWSYSWTVANAMRWYLSGAKQGVKGKSVERASDLLLGDIICYDFEGDGRWNHTTIVVAKDANDEPLVNAHTSNSYHRFWNYEDSTAYTPQIQYKFFRIGE
ncbi:amidase domain-containing protein [Pontibacillus sp. HMF3514]|uniref:amidase domain-containing protein n=1 Tax=Pontibacillus sp. HMF3514 TaxID=2692425 RepID=UPI00131FE989|nr:amidase domain-containing protein [Pontibacillus sp. HMF3514]QHE51170.1 hypothetical protein GS400_03620 [Pontibacillus sp. HMF3514]